MKATYELRYLEVIEYIAKYPPSEEKFPNKTLVLQQKWITEDGQEEWREIPVVKSIQ